MTRLIRPSLKRLDAVTQGVNEAHKLYLGKNRNEEVFRSEKLY